MSDNRIAYGTRSFFKKPSAPAGRETRQKSGLPTMKLSPASATTKTLRSDRLVAKALLNKGVISAQGIRFDEARAAFDEVIAKYKNAADPELQLGWQLRS